MGVKYVRNEFASQKRRAQQQTELQINISKRKAGDTDNNEATKIHDCDEIEAKQVTEIEIEALQSQPESQQHVKAFIVSYHVHNFHYYLIVLLFQRCEEHSE